MKAHLEITGERVVEEDYLQSVGTYTIYAMHAASYRFAEAYCRDKKVLDMGCGSGYGTRHICTVAQEAHGFDVAEDAIAYARERYQSANLHYHHAPLGSPLPFPDESFDVILSFQVIEHIKNDEAYLLEARRLLREGGILIVITPDRKNRLLPAQKPWNRWHVREYSQKSLNQLVSRHFSTTHELRLGAAWNVAKTEIRRYRKTKWLTLPATLPFIPEFMRRSFLNTIHTLMDTSGARSRPPSREPKQYDFDESAFVISKDPPNSMNIVIIAEHK